MIINKVIKWLSISKIIFNLGFLNVLRVMFYRLALKFRIHPVQHIKASTSPGPFFRNYERKEKNPINFNEWEKSIVFFGWYRKKIEKNIPDWFLNPFSDENFGKVNTDWWKIEDFGNQDIKCVWEISRFNWVISDSINTVNGNKSSIPKLNFWLENWSKSNPPYKGPNWKCAQECSIRVINLITASWILGQDSNPESGLDNFIITHLQRIEKTLSYAIAQQNNHATSEAAALFIGGSFLSKRYKSAKKWEIKGRQLLERHSDNLIESDGTFSQYSLNYHRLMLDTFSLVEAWRYHKNLEFFSEKFLNKLILATEWLWTFSNEENGEVPNIGANDGSQILQLSTSDFKDYRPSIQLAAALFMKVDVFGDGPWNEHLKLLRVKKGKFTKKINSKTFKQGGYHIFRKDKALVVLNYPKFRFRPSHADALHLDFWVNGKNLLRDAGSFSYNSEFTDWYVSTAAHNTIEFDNLNQMPRISKFLFGDCLKSVKVKKITKNRNNIIASAAYVDKYNNWHQRKITLKTNELVCYDKIDGCFKEACLRWRLIDEDWKLNNKSYTNGSCSISIKVNNILVLPKLDKTLESRYYYHQKQVPMLHINVNKPSSIITIVKF